MNILKNPGSLPAGATLGPRALLLGARVPGGKSYFCGKPYGLTAKVTHLLVAPEGQPPFSSREGGGSEIIRTWGGKKRLGRGYPLLSLFFRFRLPPGGEIAPEGRDVPGLLPRPSGAAATLIPPYYPIRVVRQEYRVKIEKKPTRSPTHALCMGGGVWGAPPGVAPTRSVWGGTGERTPPTAFQRKAGSLFLDFSSAG